MHFWVPASVITFELGCSESSKQFKSFSVSFRGERSCAVLRALVEGAGQKSPGSVEGVGGKALEA